MNCRPVSIFDRLVDQSVLDNIVSSKKHRPLGFFIKRLKERDRKILNRLTSDDIVSYRHPDR
jgi:hypothetical protein